MKRRLFLILLAGSLLTAAQPACALQLVDPPANQVLAGRVQLALESFKIIDAYPDRTFQGTRPFTRYELADATGRSLRYLQQRHGVKLDQDARIAMIYEAYLKPSGDIPVRHWAAGPLRQVLGYGLMTGTQELNFHGSLKVSRYMLALTLNRIFAFLQVEPVKMQARSTHDVPDSHWASEAVRRLVAAGIFEPDASGRFNGERPATRYELAETMVKLLQQVDLVAQQRPLQPQDLVPIPVPEQDVQPISPTGRRPPFYR